MQLPGLQQAITSLPDQKAEDPGLGYQEKCVRRQVRKPPTAKMDGMPSPMSKERGDLGDSLRGISGQEGTAGGKIG